MEIHPPTESIQQGIAEIALGKILLVDDDAAVLDVTKSLLEHLGFQVTATPCSIAALDLFKADPSRFDLVITDMIMPRLKGDALARTIREIRPDLPVIIATGFSEDSLEKARAIGIRDFIIKPFMLPDLERVILKVLGERPCQDWGQVDDHNHDNIISAPTAAPGEGGLYDSLRQ